MSQEESATATSSSSSAMDLKKQQRLAAWRQKQQQQQQQQVQSSVSLPPPPPPPPPPPRPAVAPLPPVKLSWNVAVAAASKQRKKKRKMEEIEKFTSVTKSSTNSSTNTNLKRNPFDDDEDNEDEDRNGNISTTDIEALPQLDNIEEGTNRPRKRNRWDRNTTAPTKNNTTAIVVDPTDDKHMTVTQQKTNDDDNVSNHNDNDDDDTLEQFMAQLHSVAPDDATAKIGNDWIHFSGTVQQKTNTPSTRSDRVTASLVNNDDSLQTTTTTPNNASATTSSTNATLEKPPPPSSSLPVYHPNDWLSDVNPNTDNEEETDTDMEDEQQRWELIKALKQEPLLSTTATSLVDETSVFHNNNTTVTGTSVSNKLSFREQHQKMVQELAQAAKQVRDLQRQNVQDIGREFFVSEEDDGIVEEAIREYEAATQQQSDSTFMLLSTVDQAMNKKKELTSHHHESGQIPYAPFQKNIYRVSKSVASLTPTQVTNRRAKLRIRVRGVQVPAPVSQFHEMGLPESVLQYMTQHNQPPITTPYPIQAQCIPCILAGRDVIGIAKTGSGKTLAYVLPMLRHIIVQPPLGRSTTTTTATSKSSSTSHRGETGPIALILVPARELAFQIHSVCKPFAKLLGLK